MLGVCSGDPLAQSHGDCERSPERFSKAVFHPPCTTAVKSQEQGQEILRVPAQPQLLPALKVYVVHRQNHPLVSVGCLKRCAFRGRSHMGWPYTMSPERQGEQWREGPALDLGCGGSFSILGTGDTGQWAPREGEERDWDH